MPAVRCRIRRQQCGGTRSARRESLDKESRPAEPASIGSIRSTLRRGNAAPNDAGPTNHAHRTTAPAAPNHRTTPHTFPSTGSMRSTPRRRNAASNDAKQPTARCRQDSRQDAGATSKDTEAPNDNHSTTKPQSGNSAKSPTRLGIGAARRTRSRTLDKETTTTERQLAPRRQKRPVLPGLPSMETGKAGQTVGTTYPRTVDKLSPRRGQGIHDAWIRHLRSVDKACTVRGPLAPCPRTRAFRSQASGFGSSQSVVYSL